MNNMRIKGRETLVLNFLKSIPIEYFKNNIEKDTFRKKICKEFGLKENASVDEIANYLLVRARKLIDAEKRTDALIILKRVKAILPMVDKKIKIYFYITLANSFILANEYEGAKKAAEKARSLAQALNEPKLIIQSLNILFAIYRTIEKDKAIKYLLKSQQIAEQNNIYENIVYTEVNIGLIHLFNHKITEAADSCKKVVEVLLKHPYPNNKIHMPADFFLHLFNENNGLIVSPKYKETFVKGVDIVIRALKQMNNVSEKARRLSILLMSLKISDEIIDKVLDKILTFVEEEKVEDQAMLYAAIANGLGDYNGYKRSLSIFQRAMKVVDRAPDEQQLRIHKNYAYLLSSALNITMVYDLATSKSNILQLKNIRIKTDKKSLLGPAGTYKYRSAINDSDAIFGLTEKDIVKKLLAAIKDKYKVTPCIIDFRHNNGSSDLVKNIELLIINAVDFKDQLTSILLSGSTVKEKTLKKKKKAFESYQIIGHIVPPEIAQKKHFEDFDIYFIYSLMKSPQKYKAIELLKASEELKINYESLLS